MVAPPVRQTVGSRDLPENCGQHAGRHRWRTGHHGRHTDAGNTLQEHDRIMKKVAERATECNIKLNFDKYQVKQSKVDYVGHLVTDQGLEPDPEKIRAVRKMPVPQSKENVRRFLDLSNICQN